MFTIKHESSNGTQEVFEATEVKYLNSARPREVLAWMPGRAANDPAKMTEGRVYVMNENGKTVSTWDLGKPGEQ